jgi:RNase P subunit RPR2
MTKGNKKTDYITVICRQCGKNILVTPKTQVFDKDSKETKFEFTCSCGNKDKGTIYRT